MKLVRERDLLWRSCRKSSCHDAGKPCLQNNYGDVCVAVEWTCCLNARLIFLAEDRWRYWGRRRPAVKRNKNREEEEATLRLPSQLVNKSSTDVKKLPVGIEITENIKSNRSSSSKSFRNPLLGKSRNEESQKCARPSGFSDKVALLIALLNCPMTRLLLGDVETQVRRKHSEAALQEKVNVSPESNVPKVSSRAVPQSAADVLIQKSRLICDQVSRGGSQRCSWRQPAAGYQYSFPTKNSLCSHSFFFFFFLPTLLSACKEVQYQWTGWVFQPFCHRAPTSNERLNSTNNRLTPDVTQFFTCLHIILRYQGMDIEMIHYCGVFAIALVGEL